MLKILTFNNPVKSIETITHCIETITALKSSLTVLKTIHNHLHDFALIIIVVISSLLLLSHYNYYYCNVVGPIPPWFKRYGHSLDAVDINGDGISDVMILMGGYSPSPSNDVWITEDGVNWG